MTGRAIRILDAEYASKSPQQIVRNAKHLSAVEQKDLENVFIKFPSLFDGTLGSFKGPPVTFDLKPGAKPVQARPFPVPHSRRETFRKELQRLVKLGVLEKNSDSQWASPSFIIAKKNNQVRFLTDFRQVNDVLLRKPYPIPKILDMMQTLQGFKYATTLDLNMGYYTLSLDKSTQDICTIVTPWGKYSYKRLPMGVKCAPDVFQDKMSSLMSGLKNVLTYLDDLLVLSNGSFQDHLDTLTEVLRRLSRAGLRVNADKSVFCAEEVDYLGYTINRCGIQPQRKKIQAILNLAVPRTVRDVRRILGIIQYYRDLWPRRSHTLVPLTDLVSTKDVDSNKKRDKLRKIVWTETCQKAFDEMKRLVCRETLLTYPRFDQPFILHTDSSQYQLGAIIEQQSGPLAYYSHKLSDEQCKYTTGEQELLSVVETLKEFKNMLFGYRIIVYTDHLNLVHKTLLMSSDRIMRWRLLLEEYGITLKHIKGVTNTVADALSRHPIREENNNPPVATLAECMAVKPLKVEREFPLEMPVLRASQQKERNSDKDFRKYFLTNRGDFSYKMVNNEEILCLRGKLYVPKDLREKVIDWYHFFLCHPGSTRLYNTLKQHLDWPGMALRCVEHTRTCDVCQRYKKTKIKYGKIPAKKLT